MRGYADGKGGGARFNRPFGIMGDWLDNLYVVDQGNDAIRKIAPDGSVTTVASTGERGFADGPWRSAQFNTPAGLTVDRLNNFYVADQGNNLIRKIATGQPR